MATKYFFREFQEIQLQTLARAAQAHQAYLDALQARRPFKGSMHWKKINGKEYLYKYRDRYGHGGSLGPRTPETEQLLANFGRERQALTTRLGLRREHLAASARFCRAALINRVPEPVMRVLHRFELSDLPGAAVTVIGTHALHAFEFAAGVFIDPPQDAPFWPDATHRLTLAAAALIPPEQLLLLLRQADRSFRTLPGNDFEAVNKAGFRVRLLRPPAVRPQNRPRQLDAPGPAVPAESGDLISLLSAPKFSQVVIGKRGAPATMVVPDPRALALHKLWLSQQADRDPSLKIRDRVQAMALAELIVRYLPQYAFFSADLNLFPAEVSRHAENFVEGYEIPRDLEFD